MAASSRTQMDCCSSNLLACALLDDTSRVISCDESRRHSVTRLEHEMGLYSQAGMIRKRFSKAIAEEMETELQIYAASDCKSLQANRCKRRRG
jgi:hypothetical protein